MNNENNELNNIQEKPASQFLATKKEKKEIQLNDLVDLNNNFWQEQSVSLHKCFKTGRTYANNSDNKDTIDLLQDLVHLIETHFKNSTEDSKEQLRISQTFKVLHESIKIFNYITTEPDKNCFLSTLQGYILGCLKRYEK